MFRNNQFIRRSGRQIIRSLCCLGLAGVAGVALAQDIDFDAVEIRVVPVQANVYALFGAGGNITVQVGEQGVLVVDTMFEPLAGKVLAAIRELSDKPIQYVVNTHAHLDHVGGNIPIAAAGISVTEGNVRFDSGGFADDLAASAAIVAHENVVSGMIDQDLPFEMWPGKTFYQDKKDLYFNGESIQLIHMPNAHTDGDIIVYFRRSDVISTGDLFNTMIFPYIDVENGGSINGLIDAVNNIIDIAIPARSMEGGTMLVPGHGRITDEYDLVEYRDMLTIIRDRIQAMVDEGMSLRQVQAMDPTAGWNNRWGADLDFWTTEQFVEAIYEELSREST